MRETPSLPWRRELRELLSRAGADPAPALRRSSSPHYLFAFALDRLCPETREAFPLLAAEAGWEACELSGWLHLRKASLVLPESWLPLLPAGEEPDALRRLLSLHPACLPAPNSVWELLKALEQEPSRAERACRRMHRSLAIVLRAGGAAR